MTKSNDTNMLITNEDGDAMDDYYSNVASNPEKFGLRIFQTLELTNEPYEYNTIVLFERISDGQLFYAHDMGCSCPTPFEQFNSIDDLTVLDNEGVVLFEQWLKSMVYDYEHDEWGSSSYSPSLPADVVGTLAAIGKHRWEEAKRKREKNKQ